MNTKLFLLAIVAVVVVGIEMAVLGTSAESFMGLILLGVGAFLAVASAKYFKDPTYTDASGQQKTVGRGMLMFMCVLAAGLVVGGIYVVVYGVQ